MKKVFENRILLVIVTAILFTGVGAYAANYYATDVIYNKKDGKSTNVNDALTELYNEMLEYNTESERNIIVANYLNQVYTAASSWTILPPTIYDIRYFSVNNNQLVVKEEGKYKIYYQSASDGGTSSMAYIRVLINNVEVASCGGYYARCANEEKSYVSDLKIGDTIEIDAYSTSVNLGARAVISIVKINEE